MTIKMEMKLLNMLFGINSERIDLVDLTITIIQEYKCISTKGSNDFMHPMCMKNRRVNVIVLARGNESEFERYFNARTIIRFLSLTTSWCCFTGEGLNEGDPLV